MTLGVAVKTLLHAIFRFLCGPLPRAQMHRDPWAGTSTHREERGVTVGLGSALLAGVVWLVCSQETHPCVPGWILS